MTRKLQLGLIGGGPGSWIGRMHQTAAELSGRFEVVAGVFSADAERSRAAGPALGVDTARSYATVNEMLAHEAGRLNAIAIMTPNDTHATYSIAALKAGLAVFCDKPVAMSLTEARAVANAQKASGKAYAIAHGYSAYPMTRLAQALVAQGKIGALRFVQVEYIQSSMSVRVEDGAVNNRLRWLLDPSRSGEALVMSAIGCHAQHLACFVCGERIASVSADVGPLVPNRRVIDTVNANLRFTSGARGSFVATQAAAGSENDIRLRVYGEKGHLDWSHRGASYLNMSIQGEATQRFGRGDAFLENDLSNTLAPLSRSPRGHPEGLRDAFANLYAEFADTVEGKTYGLTRYPTIEDGVHTCAFTEACIASHRDNGAWAKVDA